MQKAAVDLARGDRVKGPSPEQSGIVKSTVPQGDKVRINFTAGHWIVRDKDYACDLEG
jgi:hypothetical protein